MTYQQAKKRMYLHSEYIIAEITKLPEVLKVRRDKEYIIIAESEIFGNEHRIEIKEGVEPFEDANGILYIKNTVPTEVYCLQVEPHCIMVIPKGIWQIYKVQEFDYLAPQSFKVNESIAPEFAIYESYLCALENNEKLIEDNIIEGDEPGCFCEFIGNIPIYYYKGFLVPDWLYEASANELTADDYFKCETLQEQIAFVLKVGFLKLINLGQIVDSYENYPKNEMWSMFEYKLIDMSYLPCFNCFETEYYLEPVFKYSLRVDYAPFLYMKNHLTGEYQLKGVSKECKNLYDALRMRYNGLNIQDFEIKNIK